MPSSTWKWYMELIACGSKWELSVKFVVGKIQLNIVVGFVRILQPRRMTDCSVRTVASQIGPVWCSLFCSLLLFLYQSQVWQCDPGDADISTSICSIRTWLGLCITLAYTVPFIALGQNTILLLSHIKCLSQVVNKGALARRHLSGCKMKTSLNQFKEYSHQPPSHF